MANKKDSELVQMTGSQLDMNADRIRVTDVSVPETKTITALELIKGIKVWSPYLSDSPLTSLTGVTTEQILATIPIPANTIQVGDIISIKVFNGKFGANAAGTHRIKFNTTPDLAGSPVAIGLANNGAGASAHAIKWQREIFCISQSSQRVVSATGSNLVTDDTAIGSQPVTVAVDFTVQQYLLLTSKLTSALDTALLVGYYVDILRKP